MTADTLIALCGNLSDNLWLQGLLLILVTGFLEDAARCGVGLLVSAGHIRWGLALFCMAMGAVVADGIVYFLGRFASELMLRRHWVDANRLVKTQESFARHAVQAIIIARFIPGVRLVTYLAAGTIQYSIARFFFWLFVAGLIQGVIFLQAADLIAQTILPYFHEKHTHLGIIAGIVILLLVVHGLYLRHRRRVNIREAKKAAEIQNKNL